VIMVNLSLYVVPSRCFPSWTSMSQMTMVSLMAVCLLSMMPPSRRHQSGVFSFLKSSSSWFLMLSFGL